LIEVLLATLVLGMFLSIAFSQQAESVVLESRARMEVAAASQIRCKMSEIELQVRKDGFPVADEEDSGPCCEAFEDERFECSWTIQQIELPSAQDLEEAMQEQATDQTLVATGDDEEATSFAEQTQSFLSLGALGQILPVVQGLLRDAIRKVEVTIVWKYRNVMYDFTVSQYLTNPTQGALGAFLQQNLVQQLMQGGDAALFQLLFGGDAGSGTGSGTGGQKTP
jgi:hypothetical protein